MPDELGRSSPRDRCARPTAEAWHAASPHTAFTFAPCSMRYAHASTRPLIAPQCRGVMSSSSSLSVTRARPELIRERSCSVLPCCAASKMSSCQCRPCVRNTMITVYYTFKCKKWGFFLEETGEPTSASPGATRAWASPLLDEAGVGYPEAALRTDDGTLSSILILSSITIAVGYIYCFSIFQVTK